jgi:hypothetical protein
MSTGALKPDKNLEKKPKWKGREQEDKARDEKGYMRDLGLGASNRRTKSLHTKALTFSICNTTCIGRPGP